MEHVKDQFVEMKIEMDYFYIALANLLFVCNLVNYNRIILWRSMDIVITTAIE